jgi:hypothetical protein
MSAVQKVLSDMKSWGQIYGSVHTRKMLIRCNFVINAVQTDNQVPMSIPHGMAFFWVEQVWPNDAVERTIDLWIGSSSLFKWDCYSVFQLPRQMTEHDLGANMWLTNYKDRAYQDNQTSGSFLWSTWNYSHNAAFMALPKSDRSLSFASFFGSIILSSRHSNQPSV